MTESASSEPRKRMLFMALVLGVMAGVTAYLAYRAFTADRPVLLAIIPAILLTAVPMAVTLARTIRDSRARR